MMSTGLPMTKPDMAAAVPVNEFSRLMTTGMSAPPMGSTSVTPKMSAAPKTTMRNRLDGATSRPSTPAAPSTRMSVPMAGDRRDRPGSAAASRAG